MYIKFVTQKDEICFGCGKELPAGSQCVVDEDQEVLCPDCYEKLETDKDIKHE